MGLVIWIPVVIVDVLAGIGGCFLQTSNYDHMLDINAAILLYILQTITLVMVSASFTLSYWLFNLRARPIIMTFLILFTLALSLYMCAGETVFISHVENPDFWLAFITTMMGLTARYVVDTFILYPYYLTCKRCLKDDDEPISSNDNNIL
jgi:cytochrome bd-type quinol oxidase subunit 2